MILNRGVPTGVETSFGKSLTVCLRRRLGNDFEFPNWSFTNSYKNWYGSKTNAATVVMIIYAIDCFCEQDETIAFKRVYYLHGKTYFSLTDKSDVQKHFYNIFLHVYCGKRVSSPSRDWYCRRTSHSEKTLFVLCSGKGYIFQIAYR